MAYTGTSEFLYDNINAAAADIAQLAVTALRADDGLHPPTALAFVGYMIGETLLRASGLALDSGQAGRSIDHDWLTNNGLRLVQMLQEWFGRHEVVIADLPTTFRQYGAVLKPRAEPALLAVRMRAVIEDIFTRHEIGSEERVLAMALAATRLVLSARTVMNPSIGAAVVIDALVMGARTIPVTDSGAVLAPDLCFLADRYLPLTVAS